MPKITGRILAIDYGEKRLGIAVSDPLGIIPQGLPTIEYKSLKEVKQKLKEIIEQYEISQIVVGHPLNLRGEVAAAATQVQTFVQKIKMEVNLPIILWDERFTSVEAERILRQLNISPSRNKSKIDQISAMIVLQNYLDSLK